jgi:hypothetical protein
MRSFINTTLLTATICTLLTGCYRMPTDDDYSLVPMTNNPTTTRQHADSPMPQASY